MKKLAILISAFLTISLLPSAQAANDAYNPLTVKLNSDGTRLGFMEYVVEGAGIQNTTFVALAPNYTPAPGESRVWRWCTGIDDPLCDPAKNPKDLEAMTILPPCTDATQENCLDSLEIGTDSTNLKAAKLIRITDGDVLQPDSRYNFPGSSTISLWNVPGTEDNYAITSTDRLLFNNGKFHPTDFYADVTPYRLQSGNYKSYKVDKNPNTKPEDRFATTGTRDHWSCLFTEDGTCGVAQDLAANTRIRLKVRLTKEIGGWFQGRIQDPILSVQSFSPTNNLITIDASSVTVPRLAYTTYQDAFTQQEKTWFSNFGTWPASTGQGTGPQAGHPDQSFPFIDYFRSKLKDTASGVNHFWNVTTTSYGNGSQCLQDKSKVLGIVTTNAMAYDGTSPSFSDGNLDYHVSGLHYMPDGTTPVQGTYNLVMRSDTARCLYGFTSAPIKATISIVGAENSPIATVVTGEKDGWLSLSANGFTFSQKTLQVKLSQDAPGKISSKKITCIKGKITKVVTTASCPSGYKKK